MSSCSNDCGSCASSDCGGCDEKKQKIDFLEKPNKFSSIKKVIGVVSGKGGVGKSSVTSMLAVAMNKKGYKTAVLDADITGPSIPKIFNAEGRAVGTQEGIYPAETKGGISLMSINLLLENSTDPVVWRGPVIAGVVKQFWTDVVWGDIDYMFVDMPPGTGDVPLTVFQSIPVDGIIIVTSPQGLVSMIVSKAVKMAEMMEIPIIGIVENYSYLECPDCKKRINVFGKSHVDEIARQHGLKVLAQLPIDPEFAEISDNGNIESYDVSLLDCAVNEIENTKNVSVMNFNGKIAVTSENGVVFQHFGHTEAFDVFEIDNGNILSKSTIRAAEGGHGALAGFLKDNDVGVIICGNIGEGAKTALADAGITLVAGAFGKTDDAVMTYLSGKLMHDDTVSCSHHEGERDCSSGGCGGECHCGE